jgi:hypothetical protein
VFIHDMFTSAAFGRDGVLFLLHGTFTFFHVVLDFHIAFHETTPRDFEISHS